MKTITRGLAVLGALVVGWIAFSYFRIWRERARAALVEEETDADVGGLATDEPAGPEAG
jgi:uncharacterized membrane protein YeiB